MQKCRPEQVQEQWGSKRRLKWEGRRGWLLGLGCNASRVQLVEGWERAKMEGSVEKDSRWVALKELMGGKTAGDFGSAAGGAQREELAKSEKHLDLWNPGPLTHVLTIIV